MSEKKMGDTDQSALPAGEAEGKGKKPKKQKTEEIHLPFLVEVIYAFSGLFLVLISATVLLVSLVSGAQFLQIVLRTGVTLVVFGILLQALSMVVSKVMFEAAVEENKDSSPGSLNGKADAVLGLEKDIRA